MAKLVILASSRNTGDLAQKDAILTTISSKFDSVIGIDLSQEDALIKYTDLAMSYKESNEQFVILAIGTHGENFLGKIPVEIIQNKKNYIALSTHQYTKKIEELAESKVIDHILIPGPTLNFTAKETLKDINKTLPLSVLSPTLDLEAIFEASREKEIISLEHKYIIVTLPGFVAFVEKGRHFC